MYSHIHSAFGDGKVACYPSLCLSSRALRRSLPASVLPRAVSQLRWGVVQLVGHLTVNEDGEGSNPSAPANFPSGRVTRSSTIVVRKLLGISSNARPGRMIG